MSLPKTIIAVVSIVAVAIIINNLISVSDSSENNITITDNIEAISSWLIPEPIEPDIHIEPFTFPVPNTFAQPTIPDLSETETTWNQIFSENESSDSIFKPIYILPSAEYSALLIGEE